MCSESASNVKVSYDSIADEYVRRIAGELVHKPFDRALLDRFAAEIEEGGPVVDIGCGPGHVTRYLHDRGVRASGLDLSSEMVRRARDRNPNIEFQTEDMRYLPMQDGSLAGIVALYSLIHIPREEVTDVLKEFRRVLAPIGLLLLSFHVGDNVLHLEEWWNHKVSVDFVFFTSAEMKRYLSTAGFEVTEVLERAPYAPEVEHQSTRCYIMARA